MIFCVYRQIFGAENNLSEAARLFLLNNDATEREAMPVALSIKEMGSNIIR